GWISRGEDDVVPLFADGVAQCLGAGRGRVVLHRGPGSGEVHARGRHPRRVGQGLFNPGRASRAVHPDDREVESGATGPCSLALSSHARHSVAAGGPLAGIHFKNCAKVFCTSARSCSFVSGLAQWCSLPVPCPTTHDSRCRVRSSTPRLSSADRMAAIWWSTSTQYRSSSTMRWTPTTCPAIRFTRVNSFLRTSAFIRRPPMNTPRGYISFQ